MSYQLPPDLMAAAVIPARYPLSPRQVRRICEERRVPVWVLGHRAYVRETDIDAYLAGCERPRRTAA